MSAKGKEPETAAERLLAVLAEASEDDLAVLDERIGKLEGELTAVKQARQLMAARLGLAPKRGGPRKKADRPNPPVRRGTIGAAEKKLAAALSGAPMRADDAIAKAGIQASDFYRVVKCDWFAKLPDGRYQLTEVGRREALDE